MGDVNNTNLNNQNNKISKKERFIKWWKSLNKFAKIGICVGVAGVIATSITLPIVLTRKDNLDNTIDFATCSWDEIASLCTKLENEEITDTQFAESFKLNNKRATKLSDFIGKERVVKVNDVNHIVRVIDTQHGKSETTVGKTDFIVENGQMTSKVATFTFDFANLISDSNGYSLAYQWNDSVSANNGNYVGSSIRKILCGNGEYNTDIYCATKSSASSSTPAENNWDINYKNKNILSMLPIELSNVIKTTRKTVRVKSADPGTFESSKEYDDKLFMLSYAELNKVHPEDEGIPYTFYTLAQGSDNCIKKQVKGSEGALTVEKTISPASKPTLYQSEVKSYAGYNNSDSKYGGYYWVRSPYAFWQTPDFTKGSVVDYQGNEVEDGYDVSGFACGIAPAFCI